jgi:DNA-binding MarR family transcriptional regulator
VIASLERGSTEAAVHKAPVDFVQQQDNGSFSPHSTQNVFDPKSRGALSPVILLERQIDDMNLSAAAFRIFVHLARRANIKKGYAWPGIRAIAEHCSLSPKTVIRAVKELEMLNMIKANRRAGENTQYTLKAGEDWKSPAQCTGVDRTEALSTLPHHCGKRANITVVKETTKVLQEKDSKKREKGEAHSQLACANMNKKGATAPGN